jgi:hypothetical protein
MNVPSVAVVDEVEMLFKPFYKVLSKPQYGHFYRIVISLMICLQAHRVTDIIRLWKYRCHWTNAYKFLRSTAWDYTYLVSVLWDLIYDTLGHPLRVFFVADDTTVRHAGAKKMEAVSIQHNSSAQNDPCRPKNIWGHRWVLMGVAAMLTPMNWEVMPLMTSLVENGISKLEMCLKMICVLSVPPGTIFTLIADGWYTKRPLILGLEAKKIFYIGKVRRDARVYEMLTDGYVHPKGKRGPKLKKGERIRPCKLVDTAPDNLGVEVIIRGKKRLVDYWNKVVVVAGWDGLKAQCLIVRWKIKSGNYKHLYLLCTDLGLTPEEIIKYYDARWMIEPCFCDLKQKGGFADYSGRKSRGHKAWAQLCCVARTLLVILNLIKKGGLIDPWRRSTQPDYTTVGQKRLELTSKLFNFASLTINNIISRLSAVIKCQRTKIR